MDKHVCFTDSFCHLQNSFWNVLMPITECCPSDLTDSIRQGTGHASLARDDALAAYLDLYPTPIVSVERVGLLIAGVLAVITTIVLVIGTFYMTCFRDDKFDYSAIPQIDFMDEGVRDLESLIHILSEIGHPLHKTVKLLAIEFDMIKQRLPGSNL